MIKTTIDGRSTKLRFLDQCSLFSNLDRYEKYKLLDVVHPQWFRNGDVIVREDEIGDLFYIVEDGVVECLKKDENPE